MGRHYKFSTAQKMMNDLTDRLAFARPEKADAVTSVDIQIHNVLSSCESFDLDFNLKRYFLSLSRWNSLARQYIDPTAFDQWLDKASTLKGKKRGIAVMRTNEVPIRVNKVTSRRWGSCILSISYKAMPRPTIVLHSRTSYLGYLTGLDLNVAHLSARLLGDRLGVDVKEMAFEWFAENLQYHHFRCVGYAFGDPEVAHEILDARPRKDQSFGIWGNVKWWDKFRALDEAGELYETMSFNQVCRMRRRIHTEVFGVEYSQQFATAAKGCNTFAPLPRIRNQELTFDTLYRGRD